MFGLQVGGVDQFGVSGRFEWGDVPAFVALIPFANLAHQFVEIDVVPLLAQLIVTPAGPDLGTRRQKELAGGVGKHYRSLVAASIFQANGVKNVTDVRGGFADIKAADAPLTDYVCPTTLL